MYNACTIMYIHIRSQASDWNCCVKRLIVRERDRYSATKLKGWKSDLKFRSTLAAHSVARNRVKFVSGARENITWRHNDFSLFRVR